ncbi:MAG: ABC transporter ATP-binding protein [Lachnospiraceae bacterium]|nr:ABC transporter ATP-binding protein [Lachnospiraceae bacterium]
MEEYVLQTQALSKSFGNAEILSGIDMAIERGSVCGLVGENGAGKTTLLRVISGLMKPSHGSVRLNTKKAFIGYMPQTCRFDDRATVLGTIQFFAKLRLSSDSEATSIGKRLNLNMDKKVKHLSPGQQKKLQMVIAMTGEPDLYILDEPTAGLDPGATFEMKNIIKEIHGSGKSILISSHILQDMDEICTDIAIMERGKLTYDNKIESSYIIKTSKISDMVLQELSRIFQIASDDSGTTLTVKTSREQIPRLISELAARHIDIFEVSAANVNNIVQEQLHIKEGIK